jgi:hypothetical protein
VNRTYVFASISSWNKEVKDRDKTRVIIGQLGKSNELIPNRYLGEIIKKHELDPNSITIKEAMILTVAKNKYGDNIAMDAIDESKSVF